MISTEERNQIIEYDNNWKKYTPTIPVVVISYKFRSNCILKHPENISNNEIICVVYDEDYTASGYDKITAPNVTFVKIKEQWRNFRFKKHWLQNYMADNRPDVKDYIIIDDDLNNCKIADLRPESTKNCIYIPLKNALGILCDLHLKNKDIFSGGCPYEIQTGTYAKKPELYVNNKTAWTQHSVLNNDFLREHRDLMFRSIEYLSEDFVWFYDCYNAGITTNSYPFVYIGEGTHKPNSLASSKDANKKNVIGALRIMKDKAKITLVNHKTSLSVKFGWGKVNKDWNMIKTILDSEPDDVKCFDLIIDKLKEKTENTIESFLVN